MCVVHVVRRDIRDVKPARNLEEEIVALVIVRHPVMGELDEETAGKDVSQPRCSRHRLGEITSLCSTRHGPIAASSERNQLPVAGRGVEIRVVVAGPVLLSSELPRVTKRLRAA